MTPANRLPIEPGDKVLDVCAAPGGKATELETQLLDAMLEYGSLAQQLLNYNTGRLANSKYYKIEVTEGKLLDGTNYGRKLWRL